MTTKNKIKQPMAKIDLHFEGGDFWIDIDSDDGDYQTAAISKSVSANSAYRIAAKKLRKMAEECDALIA